MNGFLNFRDERALKKYSDQILVSYTSLNLLGRRRAIPSKGNRNKVDDIAEDADGLQVAQDMVNSYHVQFDWEYWRWLPSMEAFRHGYR